MQFFLKLKKINKLRKCNFILCTGLLMTEEDLDYYKNLLKIILQKN